MFPKSVKCPNCSWPTDFIVVDSHFCKNCGCNFAINENGNTTSLEDRATNLKILQLAINVLIILLFVYNFKIKQFPEIINKLIFSIWCIFNISWWLIYTLRTGHVTGKEGSFYKKRNPKAYKFSIAFMCVVAVVLLFLCTIGLLGIV